MKFISVPDDDPRATHVQLGTYNDGMVVYPIKPNEKTNAEIVEDLHHRLNTVWTTSARKFFESQLDAVDAKIAKALERKGEG